MVPLATEYSKALASLKFAVEFTKARTNDDEFRMARDASIQRFEFCIELAWKTAAKIMGTKSTGAKLVIREMAQNGWLDNPELWFQFVDARNETSHSYDENVAQRVYTVAVAFLPEGEKLLKRMVSP